MKDTYFFRHTNLMQTLPINYHQSARTATIRLCLCFHNNEEMDMINDRNAINIVLPKKTKKKKKLEIELPPNLINFR
jgi:hypothetical protein